MDCLDEVRNSMLRIAHVVSVAFLLNRYLDENEKD